VVTLRQDVQAKIPKGITRLQRRRLENLEGMKLLYLRALPKVFTASLALKAAGASMADLYQWREHDTEFSVQEAHVRELIVDQLESEAVRRAYKGVRKPVYQGGLLAGHVQEYSDALLIFLLKGLKPERYRDQSTVTVTPIVKVVAGFTPQDVV
jgi:hypothetical protein